MSSKVLPRLSRCNVRTEMWAQAQLRVLCFAIPNSSCTRVALDHVITSVAAYLWSCVALGVYHGISVPLGIRLRSKWTAGNRILSSCHLLAMQVLTLLALEPVSLVNYHFSCPITCMEAFCGEQPRSRVCRTTRVADGQHRIVFWPGACADQHQPGSWSQ